MSSESKKGKKKRYAVEYHAAGVTDRTMEVWIKEVRRTWKVKKEVVFSDALHKKMSRIKLQLRS